MQSRIKTVSWADLKESNRLMCNCWFAKKWSKNDWWRQWKPLIVAPLFTISGHFPDIVIWTTVSWTSIGKSFMSLSSFAPWFFFSKYWSILKIYLPQCFFMIKIKVSYILYFYQATIGKAIKSLFYFCRILCSFSLIDDWLLIQNIGVRHIEDWLLVNKSYQLSIWND